MNGGGDRRVYARCSFCGKREDEVRTLFAGPGVFICDECVEMSREALESETLTPQRLGSHAFGLTGRELEVANLFAHGMSIEVIGHCLSLDRRAIEVRLSKTYRKMTGSPDASSALTPHQQREI